MNAKQRAQLYHGLAKLIGAGLPIDRSVELLLEQNPAADVRAYLQGIQKGLAERLTVSEAIAKHNGSLATPLEISLMAAGERGGRMEVSCEHLASYFELREKSRQKAISALIYPLILLHLGVLFPDAPNMMEGGGFTDYVPNTLKRLGVAWTVLILVAVAWRYCTKAAEKSVPVDRFLEWIPLIGSVRRHWALARFCQVFETGLLAALPITETVRLSGRSSQSAALTEAAEKAAKAIEQGEALAPSLKKTGAFGSTFINSVSTAEHAGTMDIEMSRWAKTETELAYFAQDRAAEWLPRIFYVIIVLYVASRIISWFSSYFGQANDLLNQMNL